VARRAANSKRTPEIEGEILMSVSNGTTLTQSCSNVGIHVQTWYDWCEKDESLRIRFARARELGFDAIAESLRTTTRGGGESSGDVARDKLIVETDLKLLAKWDPKRYGDKIQHTGEGGGPIQVQVYIPSNGRDT
jgi:hypothetical protein